VDLKIDGYDALGKGLTDKKRMVGWKVWCLSGLAKFVIMKLFTTKYVKKHNNV